MTDKKSGVDLPVTFGAFYTKRFSHPHTTKAKRSSTPVYLDGFSSFYIPDKRLLQERDAFIDRKQSRSMRNKEKGALEHGKDLSYFPNVYFLHH